MLLVVGTPVGNLDDLAPRALQALRDADLVAAEDTRHTGMLLSRLGLKKPLLSYHEHNEARRTEELLASLASGANIALVTDAGTPAISDPGARLVDACHSAGIPVTVIPGPCAAILALAGSGFDGSRFYFGGFLPTKSGQRENEIRAAAAREEPSVFYESPHRILKTLELCTSILPTRWVCVGRELTKHFEELRRATPAELVAHYTAHPAKGEIALVIEGEETHRRRHKRALQAEQPANPQTRH